MKVYYQHFREGGTAVTNFPPKDRPIYEEAIKRYGDPNIQIKDTPFGYHYFEGDFSLHNFGPSFIDGGEGLGQFWRIFEQVKEERIK